jgi:GntR family transcriptional regulator/MocR family aminotransferase
VQLDDGADEPLYQQLYVQIRGSILDGRLQPGVALPSSRGLATDLGVSRSTVVAAYERLSEEGYLDARTGGGTRVSRSLPDRHLHAAPSPDVRRAPTTTRPVSARARAVRELRWDYLVHRPKAGRAFRAGVPALDVFPTDEWARLLARAWRRAPPKQLGYAEPFGLIALRSAVADYLARARGVRCTPEQVMITNGSQQALDLCARALLDPGDQAWLEDPGYHGARGAVLGASAVGVSVAVDDEGLDVADGRRRAPRARMAFVTPSRQVPLGVTMSGDRRRALLDWAREANAWIFEDDYDSEFRYASRPLTPLRSLDADDCVLYAGTFSKVLLPALRLGYLVVPDALVDTFLAVRHYSDFHSAFLDQSALADFIVEGHFERHIRRMRTLYAERQQLLLSLTGRYLGGRLRVPPSDAGMTLLGWLRPTDDDVDIVRRAAHAGVEVIALSSFVTERRVPPGLLLGYAAVHEHDMEDGVRALAGVLERADRETA